MPVWSVALIMTEHWVLVCSEQAGVVIQVFVIFFMFLKLVNKDKHIDLLQESYLKFITKLRFK